MSLTLEGNFYNDVTFWINIFTTCQMLNENVNVPEFESKSQEPEKFWIKQLQRSII